MSKLSQAILAYYGYDLDQNDIDPDSEDAAAVERIIALLAGEEEAIQCARDDALTRPDEQLIEEMAKAAWSRGNSQPWHRLSPLTQLHVIEEQRAAFEVFRDARLKPPPQPKDAPPCPSTKDCPSGDLSPDQPGPHDSALRCSPEGQPI